MTPVPEEIHRLVHGELSAEDSAELAALKAQIHGDTGFFCAGYKERCLRRRLAIRMRARGVHRYGDYGSLLRSEREEYERLISVLTVNVSKFFRNYEVWRILEREVVPALFALPDRQVRIWSAGSASGEEAYTMAILLREFAEAHGLRDRLRRFQIVGSDIDRDILDRARRAEYTEMAFGEIPEAARTRWFVGPERNQLRPEVRQMVEFDRLDLLKERLPGDQHLIFCRNVTIYFEREAQADLLRRLHGSLAPGGYLVLGKVETMLGPLSREFRAISQRERIYQCL